MTDKPMIFSAPMVRALLDGRKTQTRRVLKPQPFMREGFDGVFVGAPFGPLAYAGMLPSGNGCVCSPPYAPGDRLWVREGWAMVPYTAYLHSEGVQMTAHGGTHEAAIYRAGFDRSQSGIRWRSPIHMPRWASRLTLAVTDVRVQRLQDISVVDVFAEGAVPADLPHGERIGAEREFFADLWNSIHGPAAWDANPWCCAVSFSVHRRNIDALREGDG
jgi:hypothetical protein